MIQPSHYLLFNAQQAKAIDQQIPMDKFHLMEKAGKKIFHVLQTDWPHLKNKGTLHIFCGAGNNAGDGYIIAREALKQNISVNVIAVKDPLALTNEAQCAWKSFLHQGGTVSLFQYTDPHFLSASPHDVIVDALLGIGFIGPLSPEYSAAIDMMNHSAIPILSVDIPSGLCPDTGYAAGSTVQASVTVTLITLKKGLFTSDGIHYCGKLLFSDLETRAQIYQQIPSRIELLTFSHHCSPLPKRPENTHKGCFGHVCFIAGDMGGAILLAAKAAFTTGVGKVSIIAHKEHVSALLTSCPEAIIYTYHHSLDIKKILSHVTAIVIGPGLGTDALGKTMLKKVQQANKPTVFDADALHWIAQKPSLLQQSPSHIFTPHPREAAILLKTSTTEIQKDRFAAIENLHHLLSGSVILKGSGSLLSSGEKTLICNKGNSLLATAGSGDILSGVIGGLLAQPSISASFAAMLGTWLHAAAADEAAKDLPEKRGLRASELLPFIRQLINHHPHATRSVTIPSIPVIEHEK